MQAFVLGLFGTLPTLAADERRTLGRARLVPAQSVVYALKSLHTKQLRFGILSDASGEIVAAWPSSPLAALVDAAVFSCTAGAVKPDQQPYGRVYAELDARSVQVLYVGDGGGDELRGALAAGMAAVVVRRRGPTNALAFGDTDWSGPVLDTAERLPAYLAERA